MLVATYTVTVNAAFLQEIKQDNIELQQLLEELCERLLRQRPRLGDARDLVEKLNCLRDQLAIHFSLEEAFGYFENAVTIAPRLSERADDLRSQHDLFFQDICAICEQAEQLLYHEASPRTLRQVAARYSDFHDALAQHEARETELIMEAFDDDIGVGD
jgi:hypothetical protein